MFVGGGASSGLSCCLFKMLLLLVLLLLRCRSSAGAAAEGGSNGPAPSLSPRVPFRAITSNIALNRRSFHASNACVGLGRAVLFHTSWPRASARSTATKCSIGGPPPAQSTAL